MIVRAKNLDLHPSSVFLDSWLIDDKADYHNYLMERAKTETLTYGTMPLHCWFVYFCSIANTQFKEEEHIAGIREYCNKHYGEAPSITKRRDHSSLLFTTLTYNLSNILECLVNISEMRMGWGYRFLIINGKAIRYVRYC